MGCLPRLTPPPTCLPSTQRPPCAPLLLTCPNPSPHLSSPLLSLTTDNCVAGIVANESRIAQLLHESLMLVRQACDWRLEGQKALLAADRRWCLMLRCCCCMRTCRKRSRQPSPRLVPQIALHLSPPDLTQVTALNNKIGYDKAAAIAKKAHKEVGAGCMACLIGSLYVFMREGMAAWHGGG